MARVFLKDKIKRKKAKIKQARLNREKSSASGIYNGKADIEQPFFEEEEDEEEIIRP